LGDAGQGGREYGVFAAVADAYMSGHPVAACGNAGPGGKMDAVIKSIEHNVELV